MIIYRSISEQEIGGWEAFSSHNLYTIPENPPPIPMTLGKFKFPGQA